MEELIKKVAAAFRDFVLASPELQEMVEKIVERKVIDTTGEVVTERIGRAVQQAFDSTDWEELVTDNLDTSSNVFESGVKDVVRDMTLRVEVS